MKIDTRALLTERTKPNGHKLEAHVCRQKGVSTLHFVRKSPEKGLIPADECPCTTFFPEETWILLRAFFLFHLWRMFR